MGWCYSIPTSLSFLPDPVFGQTYSCLLFWIKLQYYPGVFRFVVLVTVSKECIVFKVVSRTDCKWRQQKCNHDFSIHSNWFVRLVYVLLAWPCTLSNADITSFPNFDICWSNYILFIGTLTSFDKVWRRCLLRQSLIVRWTADSSVHQRTVSLKGSNSSEYWQSWMKGN